MRRVTEDRVDIPTSFLERLVSDKRRLVAVVGGALVLAAVLGALVVWGVVRSGDGSHATSLSGLDPVGEDGGGVSGEGADTPGGGEDRTTDAEDADAPAGDNSTAESGDGDSEAPADFVRAARVAYRIGDTLWASNEDGSSAVEIAKSRTGRFALSPDGSVLAWIDGPSHTLHLTDVAAKTDSVIGSAEDIRPSWSPDSQYLAYSALSPTRLEARRVGRDGRDDTVLGAGHAPAVSGDGMSVAYIGAGAPGAAGPVVVRELDGVSRTLGDVLATAVVFGGDGIIYAVTATTPESEQIMTAGLDGSKPRELVGAGSLGRPAMYADLMLSPSGSFVAYAATGDDGFSRAYVCPVAKGLPVALTVRRDTYPMRWSASGSVLFFVEGNAFQGEATSLLKVGADGLGRSVVVEGAGL